MNARVLAIAGIDAAAAAVKAMQNNARSCLERLGEEIR